VVVAVDIDMVVESSVKNALSARGEQWWRQLRFGSADREKAEKDRKKPDH
jgi:hypothetical protein